MCVCVCVCVCARGASLLLDEARGVNSSVCRARPYCSSKMAPHAEQDPECAICATVAASGPDTIWEDSRWLCAHCAPAPLPGWLMFYSQRHVQGPAKFNSDEAANFGLAVRHIEQKLEELTGALRIYTVAFGESTAHLHAHLIPRYAGLAPGASEDKLFEGYAFGIAGEHDVHAPLSHAILHTPAYPTSP